MLTILTQSSTFIIGDIAKLFGFIMDAIYNFFNSTMGIASLGVSIIVFTVIVRALLLPLAFKQQRSMKKMQSVQPQLKKIQDKYKGKKDSESQRKMQMEMSQLYKENNVSPFGGCLPLLIQFPIIIALFDVLRNIPAYIGNIKNSYLGIVSQVITVPGYQEKLQVFAEAKKIKMGDYGENKIIDLLAKFNPADWDQFTADFSTVGNQLTVFINEINHVNYFAGINLASAPGYTFPGILIPILCITAQFLVSKTTMTTSAVGGDDKAKQTNKTMMYMMPLITGFFVFTMPAGLGLYWLTGSVFQFVQQLIINNQLSKEKK